ncbi:MAG: carbohydrate binding family 9 domain-containing protein [Melioribacteraceae bacterium]|nr:carbohydrate binding family 9 domain-containing protein [Melioribacteraceae bacterium]
MKKFLLFICTFLFIVNTYAGGRGQNPQKTISAIKLTNETINFDGKLDEPIWLQQSISGFTQKDPNEGNPATEETQVWVAYDDTYIYVAAKLKDSQANQIDATLARRDSYFDTDWFMFCVDPYNDKTTGYFFEVNPGGTLVDGVLFNDSWDDWSWDGIWQAKTSIDSDGWSVELRIPFSQLRFNASEDMSWGVNFSRSIKRNKEKSYFVMVPKNESGFVSRFALLEGLKGIKPKQRFEVLPYIVQKASYLVHDENDPFYKSNQYKTTLGADVKVGIGSNLNLDATFNPDFGQVEVDPAVVNLSAFETFYEEKRPFFMEGSNIFNFGNSGINNNWGFNFSWPDLFYSRRIGASPRGYLSDNQYADSPSETRILGAAKLTGKIGESTSLGAISAITERTYGTLWNDGIRTREEIEPLTHFGVLRLKEDFNKGNQGIGLIATSVNRSLDTPIMKELSAQNAFAFGLDGFTMLDEDKTYALAAAVVGTYLNGSKEFMQGVQKRPYRYFQRPDATYSKYDPNITSLGGYFGRIMLNKQQGNFYTNIALGAVSPGFEQSDLGSQWMADRINGHIVLGYRWFEPDGFFRRKQIYVAHARSYDFEGNSISKFLWFNSNFTFMNYYGLQVGVNYNFESINKSKTRGGVLALEPGGFGINASVSSDSREKIMGDIFGSYSSDEQKNLYWETGFDIEWKPNQQINLSIGPQFSIINDNNQWVGNFDDPTAVNTYNTRYVFGRIEQKILSANIRLSWTFTPTLSLQLFMQPLFAVGKYSNFNELSSPRTSNYREYGTDASTVSYSSGDDSYVVDPDGAGSAEAFSISNPDFNFKSLRGNAVLRWELMPGSVFYFVWSHDQADYANAGEFKLRRDFKDLLRADGNDVFMVKFSYWFDI